MALAFIGPGASHFLDSARQRNYTAAAAFLVVDAFFAHGFWAATPQESRNQVLHFFKNLALAGGFVLLAAAADR